MDFPQGSVLKEQNIGLEVMIPPEPVNKNQRLLSKGFQIKIDRLTFSKPITITLPFEIPKFSIAPKPASIYPVVGTGDIYERLGAENVDHSRRLITFKINRTTSNARGCQTPSEWRSSFFAVASDVDQLVSLVETESHIIETPSRMKEKALAISADAAKLMTEIQSKLKGIGFAVPQQVRLNLVPMKSNIRGLASGNAAIDMNIDYWDSKQDFSAGILAHEFFHLVQNASYRGFESSHATSYQSYWVDEATAEWIAFKLYPNSLSKKQRIQMLGCDFCYRELFSYDAVNPGEASPGHQYFSMIFFAYLDTRYDAVSFVRKLYVNPATDNPDEKAAPSVRELLEQAISSWETREIIRFIPHQKEHSVTQYLKAPLHRPFQL